ncbi:MAG: tetratricopeptide repeat protein [Saprospiraceae bacterium]|nr:tetratricopeptide repeat protein [Candidatus Vicinibacter affinis]
MAKLRAQFKEDIKTKEEATTLLDKQRQLVEQQAKELADKWVTVNLDDESSTYRRAFAAFEVKNIELAKAILDSVDLKKRLALNSSEKAKEESLRDTLQKNIGRREEEIRQDVNICLFKARLNKLDNEWATAEQFYDLALQYDKGNFEVIFEVALFMQEQNQFEKAGIYYEKALSLTENPVSKSWTLLNFGILLYKTNDLSGAKKAYEEALQIQRKLAEKNPDVYLPDVANILDNLGLLLIDNSDISGAKKAYEEALQIEMKFVEINSDVYLPDVAKTLNNLGALFYKNNEMSWAKKAYEEALQIQRKFAEKKPAVYFPIVAITLQNLGMLLYTNNDISGAQKAYEEALQIQRKLAERNPDAYLPNVAKFLNPLGVLLNDNNDISGAKTAFEEALQIQRKLAEKNPEVYLPDVSKTLINLGNLFYKNNDMSGAKTAFEEALQIQRKLTEKNPDAYQRYVATSLNNLGVLLDDNNDISGAKKVYEEALLIQRKLADKNPDLYLSGVASTLNNLGNLLRDNNDMSGAKKAYEEALHIQRKLTEKIPDIFLPDVAKTLNNLGKLLKDNNDMSGAKKAYEEALQIYRKFADKNPDLYLPDAAWTLFNLGNLLSASNDISGAKKTFEEALQIYMKLAEKNPKVYNLEVAMTDINIGLICVQLLKTTGDMSLKKEGLDLMDDATQRLDIFQKTHPLVQQYRLEIKELTQLFIDFDESSFQFNQQLKPITSLEEKNKEEKDPHQKVLRQLEILRLYFEIEKSLPTNNKEIKNLIASTYGDLAWYQLFDKQFNEAEKSSHSGLEKDISVELIFTNLALALLYQGKWEDAKQVYVSMKDKKYNERTYKDIFLEDLDTMEKEGITHSDVEKARALLRN